jgi:hypothetical protein
MSPKNRKRLEDLESRIGARFARLQAQASSEWLRTLSREQLGTLKAFIKPGVTADTPVPPDVLAILQTMPSCLLVRPAVADNEPAGPPHSVKSPGCSQNQLCRAHTASRTFGRTLRAQR